MQGWKVGYAQVDITPTDPKGMQGYGRPRVATKALDPLIAQAIVLQDVTGKRFTIVTADIMAFDRTSVAAMRARLQRDHDLSPQAVTFAASHTHWGPPTVFRVTFTAGGMDPWYVGSLEDTLVSIVDKALKDLRPATISFQSLDTKIGSNRRTFDDKGNQLWLPNIDGFYDTHTPLLRITRRARGNDVSEIVLLSHACHPTSSGGVNKWTADYPGHLRKALQIKRGPTSRCMFTMGCGADAKVTHQPRDGELRFAAHPRESRAAGRQLARTVDSALNTAADATPIEPTIKAASHTGSLSFAKHRSARRLNDTAYAGKPGDHDAWWARQLLAYPDARTALPYEVQSITLGDALTLITLEGEVCSPLGPIARSLAPTEHSMVIAYANAVEGYIPSKTILKEGGYEGESSHRAYFLPSTFTKDVEKEFSSIVKRAIG